MSSQEFINLTTAVNSGSGDDIRHAFSKVNDNFNEVFAAIDYETNTTALVLGSSTSTFETNLVVSQDLTFLSNISGIADGGSF